ncbi:inositol-3-phosphate synthase [Haladaptatus sp. CMAA 1911]|uniref:inositol-3-phosphate synthase n=1 Tax=unclassified Haladaptatus TaxID=2622732 RepID=UPI003754CA2A
MSQTGVWIIGARGNVATTAITGACAIGAGVTDTTGLVTARDPYRSLELPEIGDLVFGGHDVSQTSLLSTAKSLSESGTPSAKTIEAVKEDLQVIDKRIKTGTALNCGRAVDEIAEQTLSSHSLSDVVDQIRRDYRNFADDNDLDRVIVVNAASTEPPLENADQYDTLDTFEQAIENNDRGIPASSLYAYAALVEEMPYVNFTPSTGSALGGLRQLADLNDVPHMGRDGKTGETLVKSALAPMFAQRNLRVQSWVGHNILGNKDGFVLEDDDNKAGKLASKGGVLDSILQGEFHNHVRIDYTPPLGDWKTAWDDIRFTGFLDTQMKMQFTWEGSDSALAAPLILDLIRLTAHADEYGNGGLQPQLASFFKSPLGVAEHDLSRQFELLDDYTREHNKERNK